MVDSPKEIIYKTAGKLAIVGRSISVDLSDAGLEHGAKIHPHMTVLFSKDGYNQAALSELDSLKKIYQETSVLADKSSFSFYLEDWGKESKKIRGELENLCLYLRTSFKGKQDMGRIPHV